MKRIIIHWTAGTYFPTLYEKRFYHYLVDKDGKIYKGIYSPEDNLNCTYGKYAAHTGGGNTGAIGVAMCSMAGYNSPDNIGKYPITSIQFESCMNFCSYLCRKYKLPINEDTVMTHYEFGVKHPKTTSYGKIDIVYLPPYKWVPKKEIGSFIRSKIRWYYLKNLRG